MATKIDGKAVSAALRGQIAKEASELAEAGHRPGLAVIIVGENPASQVYVRNKKNACEQTGILSRVYELPESTEQGELTGLVRTLNADPEIDGILVQLPLPAHLSEAEIIAEIAPDKDVDAFHTVNVGRIMLGQYDFLPCTPAGIMELLKYYGIDPAGKHCVVIGRSNIVGKPMAMLLLHANGTVTICHSKTKDLPEITKQADILVAAVGRAGFVTGDMIKQDAVVIDVGMNRLPDGKLTGDVDPETVEPKASYLTPVPGGVGPMTITMLLKNTITAARRHMSK